MNFLIFLVALGVLGFSGWSITRLLTGDRMLRLLLALPVVALSNVLLVFLFTVVRVPLAPWSFLIGHAVIILIALRFHVSNHDHPRAEPFDSAQDRRPLWSSEKILFGFCTILLFIITLFSFVHAVLLPTTSVDSYTNWTMRSKVSFVDQSIAFDPTEARGVAKPQYPFLVHALQIAGNQGQREWNDRAANAITWLLSLSAFAASFVLLRTLRGTMTALVTLTLIASVPLLSIHLAQGYGDIHFIEYIMLSFLGLLLFKETGDRPWLLLSSLMMAAALWTKLEGLWFGWIPWTLLLLLWRRDRWSLWAIAAPLLAFIPFLLLLAAKGLPLTPHATDAGIELHPETLRFIINFLFGFGSFGIAWYAMPLAIPLFRRAPNRLVFLWGTIAFVELIAIYTLTPNAQYLLSGEAFSRQALIPLVLLILACAVNIFASERGKNAVSLPSVAQGNF